jgi:P27 family predicted phage terminase small subunit
VAKKDPNFQGLLIRTKQGNWIQHPLVGMARRAAADMALFAAEFGMTPSSRTRVQVTAGKTPNEFDVF